LDLHGRKTALRPHIQLPGEAQLLQRPAVLPHRHAVQGHGALGGGVLGGEGAEEGGLPRPVAADEAVDLPLLQGQGHVPQDLPAAVYLGDVLTRQFHIALSPVSSIIFKSSSLVMPRLLASARRGTIWPWAKAERRLARIFSLAPGATNMPMPRRL